MSKIIKRLSASLEDDDPPYEELDDGSPRTTSSPRRAPIVRLSFAPSSGSSSLAERLEELCDRGGDYHLSSDCDNSFSLSDYANLRGANVREGDELEREDAIWVRRWVWRWWQV